MKTPLVVGCINSCLGIGAMTDVDFTRVMQKYSDKRYTTKRTKRKKVVQHKKVKK